MSWEWSTASKARMSGELFAITAFVALMLLFMLGRCFGLVEAPSQPIRATPPAPQSLAERDAVVKAIAQRREAQAKQARKAEGNR